MLHESGVSVYIQNLGIHTLQPNGEVNPVASIMVTILAEMANIERSNIVYRLNSGRDSYHIGALVTINDRLTSKVWIRKLSGKDATPLALKTIEALQPIKDLIHTITADNGKEFAKHQEIAKELQITFYFCKPYHSWERGANENTNGLIRQYIPKGTDFSEITDEFVSWVENKLNNRPRKRLGYFTPNEKFNLILTN